jgi:DNA repair protein SbcD/Mre11
MKILHTSDWHVGKVLKGRDRYDEHAAVLGSIVRVAQAEGVDLVLVAGNLFGSATPNAKAQGLVMRTLLALGEDGRQVVAIAGDHDSPGLLDAVYRPALGQAGVHVLGTPKRPRRGGMLAGRTRSGDTVHVAALPFLSHLHAARAAEALPPDLAGHAVDYPSQIAAMVRVLTQGFSPDTVNVVMTHATLVGGRRGGQREAQTNPAYELPPGMFPPSAQYAALGHLHQQQEIPGPCPIFYSGSPLALEFTDIQNASCVLIISAEPGTRAETRAVPVTGARPLQTLRGTLDEVIAAGEQAGDAYLRVVLAEPGRPGLGDIVRAKLPNALEVVLDEAHQPHPEAGSTRRVTRVGRHPLEVFGDYLAGQNVVDPRLNEMFTELLAEVSSTEGGRSPVQAGPPASWNASPGDGSRPGETDADEGDIEQTSAREINTTDTSTAHDPGLLDDQGEVVVNLGLLDGRAEERDDPALLGRQAEEREGPGLLDGRGEEVDWEYLDGAGPAAADPAAASAVPWDYPFVPWDAPAEPDSAAAAAPSTEGLDDGPADVGPSAAATPGEA